MLTPLEKITAATDVETVWATLLDTMDGYGFDRLLYAMTRFCNGAFVGDPKDMLILSNHSADYLQPFLEQSMYQCAPMVRWALENDGARSWGDLWDQTATQTQAERDVIDFNRKHGVVAGYTISFPSSHAPTRAAIGLTGRPGLSQADVDALWARSGPEIKVLCNVAHLKLASLPARASSRVLTARQREALEWIGSGKTTQDTAVLMGLTPATVEKHLRLARTNLDVETTAHAIMKASLQNQIFFVDPR